jgi:hypothetical protein
MSDVDGDTFMEDAKRPIMEDAKRTTYADEYTFRHLVNKMPVFPRQCRLLRIESPFDTKKQLQEIMTCDPLVISFLECSKSEIFDACTGSPVSSVVHVIMHQSNVLDRLKECFPNATFSFEGLRHKVGLFIFAQDPRFRDSITSLYISREHGLDQIDRIPSILENNCNVLTSLDLNIDSEALGALKSLPSLKGVFDSLQTCKFIEEFTIQLPSKPLQYSMKSLCAWLRATKSLRYLFITTSSDEQNERKSKRRAEFSDIVFALADNKDAPMTSLDLFGDLVSCESLARLFDRRHHIRQLGCVFTENNYMVFDTVLQRSRQFTFLRHRWFPVIGECKQNPCVLRQFDGEYYPATEPQKWFDA